MPGFIELIGTYRGVRTKEQPINPGVYAVGDSKLFGLAQYLITNGYARWAEIVPEVERVFVEEYVATEVPATIAVEAAEPEVVPATETDPEIVSVLEVASEPEAGVNDAPVNSKRRRRW